MVNWMIVALIAALLFVMLLIVSIKVLDDEYDWIAARRPQLFCLLLLFIAWNIKTLKHRLKSRDRLLLH